MSIALDKKTLQEGLLVFASLVVFISLLFYRLFINPLAYFTADTAELYVPWWVFTHESIAKGIFPLLNRYWFGGSMPFAALETGIFYPVYWFFNLLPLHSWNQAFLSQFSFELFHLMLGGLGFYFFCRKGLQLSKYASLFGALTFVGGGGFLGKFVHTFFVVPLGWFPWLMGCYFEYLQKRSFRYWLATVFSLTMVFLSGHPHMVYFIGLFFGLTVAFGVIRVKGMKMVLGSIGIIGVALLLSAVRIVPMLEASGTIVRINQFVTTQTLYNSLHPLYYLTLIIPKLYGQHDHDIGYWGSEFIYGSWENYPYIGLLPILFIPLSLSFWGLRGIFLRVGKAVVRVLQFFSGIPLVIHKGSGAKKSAGLTTPFPPQMVSFRVITYLWIMLGLAFFLSLGKYFGPGAFVLTHLPFAAELGLFTKVTALFHFYLCALGAVGCARFIEEKRLTKPAWLLLVVVGMIIWGFALQSDLLHRLQPAGRGIPSVKAFEAVKSNVYQSLMIFSLSLAFIYLYTLQGLKGKRWLIMAGLMTILIGDVVVNNRDFNPVIPVYPPPEVFYGETPYEDMVKQDEGIYRVMGWHPANAPLVLGIESVEGYHTVFTHPYKLIVDHLKAENQWLLSLTNIKYVVSNSNLSQVGRYSKVYGRLWKNEDVLPRVFFLNNNNYLIIKDDLLNSLNKSSSKAASFPIANFSSQVTNLYKMYKAVSITTYTPKTVGVSLNEKEDGFVVVSEFQYPGWKATVDEKSSQLEKFGPFYGLPVLAGKHDVKFSYEPDSVRVGGIVSLVTILLIIGILGRIFLERKA